MTTLLTSACINHRCAATLAAIRYLLHILTQESEDLDDRLTEAKTKLNASEERDKLFSHIREFFARYAKNVMDGMLSTQGLRRTTKGKGHYTIQVV